MRSLSFKYLEKYLKHFNFPLTEIFVETGTHKGGTIFQLCKKFKKLFTIELCEYSYNYCKNYATENNINNINFYNGQSQDILEKLIIKELNKYDNCIFFLDAHVTGKNRIDTSVGEIDVPVCLELEIISKFFNNNAIIIVDDARCFTKKNMGDADWSKINHDTITNSIKNRQYNFKYFNSENGKDKNDRLIIHLKKN
jgi:hypothetical protein